MEPIFGYEFAFILISKMPYIAELWGLRSRLGIGHKET